MSFTMARAAGMQASGAGAQVNSAFFGPVAFPGDPAAHSKDDRQSTDQRRTATRSVTGVFRQDCSEMQGGLTEAAYGI